MSQIQWLILITAWISFRVTFMFLCLILMNPSHLSKYPPMYPLQPISTEMFSLKPHILSLFFVLLFFLNLSRINVALIFNIFNEMNNFPLARPGYQIWSLVNWYWEGFLATRQILLLYSMSHHSPTNVSVLRSFIDQGEWMR